MNLSKDQISISTFKDQLNFLDSEYKVILFSDDSCFFYNKDLKKIRSFNSIFWVYINKFKLDDFIDYLDNRITEIYSKFDDKTILDEKTDGYFFDGKVIINLTNLKPEDNVISDEMYYFILYLKNIYENDRKIFDYSIDSNIDLI